MAVELLSLIAGIIYGYLKTGKEDRIVLFKRGFLLGIVIAVIIAGLVLISGISSMLIFVSSSIMIVLSIVLLTVMFIAGTFIGDWLEANLKSSPKV
jgi:hypothetical protein